MDVLNPSSYDAKEDSGIHSWLSHGDYSDNDNFFPVWTVFTEEYKLYYELADFLEYIRIQGD
jgi:hypothetical protein